MGYAPPLIKPPTSPVRPPVAPPYRPPGTNRRPPTQTAPIYQPPNVLPPTDLDLKGIICIYSNAPIWEPKKIRYRYPGENWQEIAGDRYTTIIEELGWNPLSLESYKINFSARYWCWDTSRGLIYTWSQNVEGGFYLEATGLIFAAWIQQRGINIHKLTGRAFTLWDQNGTRKRDYIGPYLNVVEYSDYRCTQPTISEDCRFCRDPKLPGLTLSTHGLSESSAKWGSTKIDSVIRISDNQLIPPKTQCEFKVFDIFNQEILSITRDDCPEVIVVPEICYFKSENERLVEKINLSPNMSLRTEYNGNCATVWMDLWPFNYFPPQIYKECSDNPNCPPPRIRFDKKCEETCEQCPPGTAIKVLLGNQIACVDAFGCIKKMIKYKPGCNNYDCICN